MKTKKEIIAKVKDITREIKVNTICDIKDSDSKKAKKTLKKLKRILKEIYDIE